MNKLVNPYDTNNAESYGIKYLEYDYEVNLRSIKYEYDNGDKFVATYAKYMNYYAPGKLESTHIEKRTINDKRTYLQKVSYAVNGKKKGQINYKFKNGVTILRDEYVFNKKGTLKGSALKYQTKYKNGAKVKTTKYFYNSKGKIYKKTKSKHRKDFAVECYSNFGYFYF